MRGALWKEVEEHVHWSKMLVDLGTTDEGVTARPEDGTEVRGSVIVGAEGSNSEHDRSYVHMTQKIPFHSRVQLCHRGWCRR